MAFEEAKTVRAAGVQTVPRHPVAGVVGYASAGRLLIAGPLSRVRPAADALTTLPHCTALITASDDPQSPPDWMPGNTESRLYHGTLESVEGYLGHYEVAVRSSAGSIGNPRTIDGQRYFDLVLDLTDTPAISCARRPPGYFAPGHDARAIDDAVAALEGLVGEFEKPVYIRYHTDLCAHGASGLTGCTRCLDACPTGAIRSLGERVDIDTHLCQGIGACATTCPSGAIDYAYPERPDLLKAIAARLDGIPAGHALLLHDTAFADRFDGVVESVLPAWALPLEVEEVASVGAEAWLTALVCGADQVIVLANRDLESAARDFLESELHWVGLALGALGDVAPRVVLHTTGAGGLPGELPPPPPPLHGPRAGCYSLDQTKRTTLWMGWDALWRQTGKAVDQVELPAGTPLGTLSFNDAACTLCMACVSVCPASALHSGGDTPRLAFIEQNCVQCGMCVTGCPEHALALSPRLLFDAGPRRAQHLLKEEAPFECIRCGKPFASPSVIRKMTEMLQNHSMFQGERLEQLKMCDDCRVRAVFADQQQEASRQERGQ